MKLHRADPKLRLVVASLLLAAIVAGVVIFALLRQWLEGLSHLPGPAAQSHLLAALAWCMALLCAALLAFAAYLWRLGAKVVLHGQLPLPGARLLRDTPELRGRPAQRRGRWLQGLGVAVLACAAAFAVLAWRLHASLASTAV